MKFGDFPFSNSPQAGGGYNNSDRKAGVTVKWPKKCSLTYSELFGGRFAKAHVATAPTDGPRCTSGNSWGGAHICSALGGNGEAC